MYYRFEDPEVDSLFGCSWVDFCGGICYLGLASVLGSVSYAIIHVVDKLWS